MLCSKHYPASMPSKQQGQARATSFIISRCSLSLNVPGAKNKLPVLPPIVASRLDASSAWLPGWTANQTGLPLALLPTANACITAGSKAAHAQGALASLDGHIAVVPGGPLPRNCSYADIVACAPTWIVKHIMARSCSAHMSLHAMLDLPLQVLPSTEIL